MQFSGSLQQRSGAPCMLKSGSRRRWITIVLLTAVEIGTGAQVNARDFSSGTFQRQRASVGVRLQQGRVQIDADRNGARAARPQRFQNKRVRRCGVSCR
jgi:hypothetical protein